MNNRLEEFEVLFIFEFQRWGWKLLWFFTSILHLIDTKGRIAMWLLTPLETTNHGGVCLVRYFHWSQAIDFQIMPGFMVFSAQWKPVALLGTKLEDWYLVNWTEGNLGFLLDLRACAQIQHAHGYKVTQCGHSVGDSSCKMGVLLVSEPNFDRKEANA